jgi:tetratricopeptide (TPR) repeat protein
MNRWFILGLAVAVGTGACLLGPGCGRPVGEVAQARARAERQPTAAAWVALGQAYARAQKFNDAFVAYRQALRRDPRDFDALCGLGEASLRLADAQGALTWADRALAVRADAPTALAVRGRARLARGDAAAALPDLQQAVTLDSSALEPRLALISAYLTLGQPDAALAQASATAAHFPNEGRGHYVYAALLDARRQWPQAEHEYREALRLDPENPAIKLALAVVLLNQHKGYDEAQHLARDVAAAAPGDGGAAGLAAWALFLSGKQDAGLRALMQAYQEHPHNLQIVRWIQTAATQTGRPDLADAAAKAIAQMTNAAR